MIKFEEHIVNHEYMLCCEYFADEATATRRKDRLSKAISSKVFVKSKHKLRTAEGMYDNVWFVGYIIKRRDNV